MQLKKGEKRKIHDLEDNEMQLVRMEIGYIFFLEDMRKIHLYCVLSLNTDLWFITFVIGHTCIHRGKYNEFSVIQRHRAQNLMSNGTRTDDTVKAYNLNNIENPLSFQADYYYQYNRKFIVVS